MDSPLSQQTRPDTFKSKVSGLYEELFAESHDELTEGFWRELFLLKPDFTSFQQLLQTRSADDLLHQQAACQHLFRRATQEIQQAKSPSDEVALDTLTVFLGCVLDKKYSSPSSDIITILAGLEDVDTVFSNLAATLDTTIRNGRSDAVRQKAVNATISLVAGAYQTGLVSYMISRDFFPSIMKLVQDVSAAEAQNAFALLGILANYNKFEFQNPYRLRFEDFVNEATIKKVVECVGLAATACRDRYAAVQPDQQDSWSIAGTLSYIGLGALSPKLTDFQGAIPLTEEQQKSAYASLPPPRASLLLSTYDFALANKFFCLNLITHHTPTLNPFASLLSLQSYLLTHAHRSPRASLYACINLLTLQLLTEDRTAAAALCSTEHKAHVRLCRQQLPLPPPARAERPLAASLLDVLLAGLSHNLRRRAFDATLHSLCLAILLRLLAHLSRARTRLAYHWPELWRTLYALLRFLSAYHSDLALTPGVDGVCAATLRVLGLAVAAGERFLPDAAAYDDLCYKTFEAGELLTSLGTQYSIPTTTDATNATPASLALSHLQSLSAHYARTLQEQAAKGLRRPSAREIARLIKSAYDTLPLPSDGGALDQWDAFKEVEVRNLVKRAGRASVGDFRRVVLGVT